MKSPRTIPVTLRSGQHARGILAIQPTPCAGYACGSVIQPGDIFTRHYQAGATIPRPQAFCVRCISFVPSKCVRCFTKTPERGDYYCTDCNGLMESEFLEALAAASGADIDQLRAFASGEVTIHEYDPDNVVSMFDLDAEAQALVEAQEAAEEAAFHELADTFMGVDDDTYDDEV